MRARVEAFGTIAGLAGLLFAAYVLGEISGVEGLMGESARAALVGGALMVVFVALVFLATRPRRPIDYEHIGQQYRRAFGAKIDGHPRRKR